MALDPTLKAAIENWWNNGKPSGFKAYCPGCGKASKDREAFELTAAIVTLKCLECGHLYFFDLDLLKQKAAIP